MENEPRLVVPCCGDPDGDTPEAQYAERLVYGGMRAKDYLIATGMVIGALGAMAYDFLRNPSEFIDKWSDDFAEETDRFLDTRL